jgi:hypothetical protein
MAAIVGEHNRTRLKEFTGEDLNLIGRVHVEVGNALASTTAGKVQMAENLAQYLGVDGGMTPEKYLTVIKTGNLDTMTENVDSQLLLTRGENKKLTEGDAVIASIVDKHKLHIKEHSAVLSDPELRFDADLVKRVNDHIMEHLNLLRTTDPALLALLGEQPLGPMAGSPPVPGGPEVNTSSGGIQEQSMQNPGLEQGDVAAQANIPSPAAPTSIPGPMGGQ